MWARKLQAFGVKGDLGKGLGPADDFVFQVVEFFLHLLAFFIYCSTSVLKSSSSGNLSILYFVWKNQNLQFVLLAFQILVLSRIEVIGGNIANRNITLCVNPRSN